MMEAEATTTLFWHRPRANYKHTRQLAKDGEPLFELETESGGNSNWTLTARIRGTETIPGIRTSQEGVIVAQQMWERHLKMVASVGMASCPCGNRAQWRFTVRRGLFLTPAQILCCPDHLHTTINKLDDKIARVEVLAW